MVKSVSCCCVRGSWLFSDPVTIILPWYSVKPGQLCIAVSPAFVTLHSICQNVLSDSLGQLGMAIMSKIDFLNVYIHEASYVPDSYVCNYSMYIDK